MKETVNVRVLKTSWKRLKVKAAKEGKSLLAIVEELSKYDPVRK
jgi:hypothetical protein